MSGTHEKKAVAIYSIMAAIFLITAKTAIGLWTGSLAILTDAVHSLLDLGASIITYFSVRISDKPSDREHHFGHGKVESLGALLQILFLLGACVGIILRAVDKIQSHSAEINLNIWAFVVILLSITIDFNRVRALRRVAKKYSSQALAADALHFSADIYVSAVVLLGLVAIKLGFPAADPIAAIAVSLFIISTAIRLARRAVDVLLDRAPAETEEIIRQTVRNFPEILDITKLRLRSDGRMTFAEMSLNVDRALTFGRADDLAARLQKALQDRLPAVDATFTLIPASAESEKTADAIRYIVSSFGLTLHHLIISETNEGPFASMHIELPGEITLDEAHSRAGEISARLHKEIPTLKKAVIHTEPSGTDDSCSHKGISNLDFLRDRVKTIVESFPGVADCHNIVLTPLTQGLALSADMRMDGTVTLEQTHQMSEKVEKKLREEITELTSITIHLEPLKSS